MVKINLRWTKQQQASASSTTSGRNPVDPMLMLLWRKLSRTLSLATFWALYSHPSPVIASTHWDGESGISVIVGLAPSATVHLEDYGIVDRILIKAGAYALTVPDESTLDQLRDHPGVEYVSYDGVTFPMTIDDEEQVEWGMMTMTTGEEQVGWGIPYIQAISDLIPAAAPATEQADGSCFRMCIVDGGLFAAHPDLPFRGPSDSRLAGQEFNLPSGQTWYEPLYHHGTHVAGIALATAHNDLGIRGVIDSTSNICLSIARIFPDSGMGQKDSVVLDAVSWCTEQNARLINLSLGSRASGTPAAERLYSQLEQDGILVVSSSGNDYSEAYNYPASFDSVVSVGAVDKNGRRASFSNYNDQVNIVAPGVAIRSTAPVSAIVDMSGQTYEMRVMEYSIPVHEMISATIHDAERGVTYAEYTDARGKICIAERGTISFLDKALLCEKYGGVAMVIYNNETGILAGTLMEEGLVSIPVVTVSQMDGTALRRQHSAIISPLVAGYTTRSGTSMAAPFVSAVAAKLWAARPACTHEQIREALYQSASTTNLQAGSEGFAESFGVGLVQADSAYVALMTNPPPCGGGGGGSVNVQPESNSAGSAGSSVNGGPSQAPTKKDFESSSNSSWTPLPFRWFEPNTPTSSNDPTVVDTVSLTQTPTNLSGWHNKSVPTPAVQNSSPRTSLPNNVNDTSWGRPWTWRTQGNGRSLLRGRRFHTGSSPS